MKARYCPCLAVNVLASGMWRYLPTVSRGRCWRYCTGPHRRLFVVCRPDTTNRTRRPILERQTFNAIEFGDVVRHQSEPEAAGVGGNKEVIGADHLPSFLQVSTVLRVVGSS